MYRVAFELWQTHFLERLVDCTEYTDLADALGSEFANTFEVVFPLICVIDNARLSEQNVFASSQHGWKCSIHSLLHYTNASLYNDWQYGYTSSKSTRNIRQILRHILRNNSCRTLKANCKMPTSFPSLKRSHTSSRSIAAPPLPFLWDCQA